MILSSSLTLLSTLSFASPDRNNSLSNQRGAATEPDAAKYAPELKWEGRGEGLLSDPLSWKDFTLLFQTESEVFSSRNHTHAKTTQEQLCDWDRKQRSVAFILSNRRLSQYKH